MVRRVSNLEQLTELERLVEASAVSTLRRLVAQLDGCGLAELARWRFDLAGCDPLDEGRPLNLVEQMNQSFTYIATIEATRWLLDRHPTHAPYRLNLGTASGSDILSEDGAVVAETFAATRPGSNDKLRRDVAKVRQVKQATHRYVFYLSPVDRSPQPFDGVTVVRLTHSCLEKAPTVNG